MHKKIREKEDHKKAREDYFHDALSPSLSF